MFTTTDVGHPLCTPPPGYMPAMGSPQNRDCLDQPFLHFEDVPAGDVESSLQCLALQGTDGCGYEAPLEAMLLAIDPDASWNQGDEPFMREDAALVIAIITDEEDCSVRAPEGYAYFTDPNQNTYWEINPDTATKTNPTSAVCWNSGVDCGAPDANGVYADCHSNDTGVLHPVDRYLTYFNDELVETQDKDVVMLGFLGVPPVLAHNPDPPFQPTAGGVGDVVYRDDTVASMQFEFGIGPGCTGASGQAIPPVRIKEVCEGLDPDDWDDEDDQIRCCIESVCDDSHAFACLGGMLIDGGHTPLPMG